MAGFLLFGLTTLAYLALSTMILERSSGSGDSKVGWVIGFALLAVYLVSSLFLTLNLASNERFNWISNNASSRKFVIAILWLGMVAGVVICTIIRTEWHANNATGIMRMMTVPVYFGAVWLPLLMLVPYAILLKPEWRDSIDPSFVKIPVILACAIGWLLLVIPKTVITKGTFSKSQTQLKDSIIEIESAKSFLELMKYSLNKDERLRNAALVKIREYQDWEAELIKILEQSNPYSNFWVYEFMKYNKIRQPDQFIEPINKGIIALTAEIQKIIESEFSRYQYKEEFLNTEILCQVLSMQFNEHSTVFRSNLIKLYELLEKPPAGKPAETKVIAVTLNKYRYAVKGWLDAN